MPNKDTYIEFEKHNAKLPCPFVIYGDFECLTTNSNNGIKGTYQEHKPCGYMLNVVSRIDNTCQPCLYRGADCMKKFVETLTEIKKNIFKKMNVNKPMDELTYAQKIEFRNATNCSICGKKFQEDDTKVKDHCHFTGKYRGAAHVKCNLDFSFKFFKIPIFFHNLKNYDAHLIIAKANELNIELNQNKRIDVIAQNSEKFITFSFGACQFKDSFAFLTASLDKLVRLNKYEGNEKIKDWDTHFRYTSTNPYIKSKTLNLLTDKGVYPYDYTWDKVDKTLLRPMSMVESRRLQESWRVHSHVSRRSAVTFPSVIHQVGVKKVLRVNRHQREAKIAWPPELWWNFIKLNEKRMNCGEKSGVEQTSGVLNQGRQTHLSNCLFVSSPHDMVWFIMRRWTATMFAHRRQDESVNLNGATCVEKLLRRRVEDHPQEWRSSCLVGEVSLTRAINVLLALEAQFSKCARCATDFWERVGQFEQWGCDLLTKSQRGSADRLLQIQPFPNVQTLAFAVWNPFARFCCVKSIWCAWNICT